MDKKMKTLKYMVLCLAVASCAQVFGIRKRKTEHLIIIGHKMTIPNIAVFLKNYDVEGGWITSVTEDQICVNCSESLASEFLKDYPECPAYEENYKKSKEDFKSVDQIIAELPKLINVPQYQLKIIIEEWAFYPFCGLDWKEKKASRFYIGRDDITIFDD